MRSLLFFFSLLFFSCNSEMPSSNTSTPAEIAPTTNSNLIQLDETTYSLPSGKTHHIKFLTYIHPKQTSFNNNNKGMGNRSDTLYYITYLPFKDQELYLYKTFLDHSRGSSLLWNIAILKNGMVQVDEQLISHEEEPLMKFVAMNTSSKKLLFEATKADGTLLPLELPYNGQTVLNLEE